MAMSPEARALYSRIRANEKETERLEDRMYDPDCPKEEAAQLRYLIGILVAAHNKMGWQLVDMINNQKPKSRNG